MEKWNSFIEQFWYILPFSFWAVVGCVARAVNSEWMGWKSFVATLITSFVAASIVGLLLDGAHLSENVICGISGVIGWGGGRIMEDLIRWTRKRAEKVIAGETDDTEGRGE